METGKSLLITIFLGVTNRIRDTFRRVLNLPPGTTIEYKAHNDSIK